MNKNVFIEPEQYIKEIIRNVRMCKEKRKVFQGKSLASIFLTKFCDAGCSHCFFKSDKKVEKYPPEQCEFSDYGIERFIEFINKSNNGYLLVIGGGEPFKKYEHILKIIKKARTDRLILVTNGMWAENYEQTKNIIFEMYENFRKRTSPTKLILRLSADKWHIKKIGYDVINNIIDVYKKYFKNDENFELQLHTLIGDNTLDEMLEKRNDFEIIRTEETGISDNEEIIKISPYRCRLNFDNGYVLYVGIAKLFYSTLKPNLMENNEHIQEAIKVFDNDMESSAFDNPSVILNKNGTLGLNFWVNYNGNVSLWGNQQLTDLQNIYCDNYEDIIEAYFNNIITYSFLDKGYKNRVNIIDEVNHKAIIRSKAINIRDYAGASILEENKTILYYAIRVIQEYLKEKKLNDLNLEKLPIELRETLKLDVKELVNLYNNSNYTIITQYKNKKTFDENEWRDLFELIKLGHYDVNKDQIKDGIEFYNCNAKEKLNRIEEVSENGKEHYDRLNERLIYMKSEAIEICTNKSKEERFKNPSSVGLLLIRYNNGKEEILLQKRKNTGYMDGYYDVGASGHVENYETMKMAVIREAKEEIGIDIEIEDVKFVTVIHDISKNVYYNGYFKVTNWKGNPIVREEDKIEEIKWFDINELPVNIIDNRNVAINNYKNNIPYSEIY